MNLFVNSNFTEVPSEINTVGKLLDHLKVSRLGTGVGVNNRLIPNKNWDCTSLNDDDRIVIISATYGG